MKIIELTFHLQSGGAERFVVDLSNELARSNDVTLLTLRDDSVTYVDRNFYKGDVSNKVKYACLGLKDGLRPSMWWKIWKYVRREKPDVVHFHGDGMAYWMLIPVLFSSRRIRFVQTLHSDFHWGGYDRGVNRLMAWLFGRSHRLRYAALAPKNYEDLTKCYPDVLAACIVNGRAPIVPTQAFDAVKVELDSYRKTPSTKILLHVARCSEVKNQKRLIEAFNRIAKDGEDVQLLMIGDMYDSELGQELKRLSCGNVHFLGVRKNIADYMLCGDLFCLSSDAEGMPITLLEALLSGTPVASTPVCGALEAIKDGENGILAKGFDTQDYVDALNSALSSFAVLKSHTEASKESIPYSIEACAEKYKEFFKK